ncbi:MAG: NAD-dependent epimerase/dehydratase family protein, partial [Betaproteobacteria bacterium]|nr:NAD-dependent epimerase/dehydratase family protein [Betaproteobacteria bacterium]
LITGGTGSIGKELTRQVLENYDVRKLIIFSRDELKQSIMREEFNNNSKLRWLLGDIRDLQRLQMAFHQVTHLIHAAALK